MKATTQYNTIIIKLPEDVYRPCWVLLNRCGETSDSYNIKTNGEITGNSANTPTACLTTWNSPQLNAQKIANAHLKRLMEIPTQLVMDTLRIVSEVTACVE